MVVLLLLLGCDVVVSVVLVCDGVEALLSSSVATVFIALWFELLAVVLGVLLAPLVAPEFRLVSVATLALELGVVVSF